MTPTLPDLLTGLTINLSAPQPAEAQGDYMAGRLGLLAMISVLAAQEAERGAAARLWENTAMRALFARSADEAGGDLAQELRAASSETDLDFTWSALDRANAGLRRLLIALHVEVEGRGDTARDREILSLYADMAQCRRLDLPGV